MEKWFFENLWLNSNEKQFMWENAHCSLFQMKEKINRWSDLLAVTSLETFHKDRAKSMSNCIVFMTNYFLSLTLFPATDFTLKYSFPK